MTMCPTWAWCIAWCTTDSLSCDMFPCNPDTTNGCLPQARKEVGAALNATNENIDSRYFCAVMVSMSTVNCPHASQSDPVLFVFLLVRPTVRDLLSKSVGIMGLAHRK